VKLDGLAIDILPLIGPGHNVAVGDMDPSPGLEIAASLTTSNLALFRPDGTRLRDMDPSAHGPLSDTAQDNSSVLNLFEYPAIGDIDRDGKLDLTKVGVTLHDIDDDGRLDIAWPTREGNYFLWDTPAPMCNTATTANLDGRDGAYNPQVNYRNNNLAGEDTVPPARLAPRDVVTSSTDLATNAITITTSRIPGDDLYCGTAAKFDFRFSTAGPITTQTQFDAATPVASVPAPLRGNHDAGASLTVRDGRFAGQVVFLAAQVVDHAGNLSPVTSLGSFAFAPPTTTTSSSTTSTTTASTTTTSTATTTSVTAT